MKIKILVDPDSVGREAATIVAAEAREAVRTRGRFLLAVSGGRSPRQMFRSLARMDIPWDGLHIFQVDERVAPLGHPDRNLSLLREVLLEHSDLRDEQIHAMPVDSSDLEAAAEEYGHTLSAIAGSPPILDLVHLGLGPDGHTASLVPGDAVLQVTATDVALTGVYQGRRRMTMTYPILNRSRQILWVVSGIEKAGMLAHLRAGDPSIPAGRVNRKQALILADCAAAAQPHPAEIAEVSPKCE